MARALVTGASGFVGSHLVESLVQSGETVRCLVRETSDTTLLESLHVEFVTGDVSTFSNWTEALCGVQTVYHVAAITRAVRSGDLMRVNTAGTGRVAEACAAQTHPPRLIIISSLTAGGTFRQHHAAARGLPVSNYGRSKRAAELIAGRWAERVPITVVRPGIVFGPRDRDTAPLFSCIKTFGFHLIPGFRWNPVAAVDARDLATILRSAAARGETLDAEMSGRGIYDAGDPCLFHYAELGRMIGRAVGRPNVLMLHCPCPLLMTAAATAELLARVRGAQTTFNLDKMRDATAGAWTAQLERTQSDLGYCPAQTFQQRLCETARWYERAGWL